MKSFIKDRWKKFKWRNAVIAVVCFASAYLSPFRIKWQTSDSVSCRLLFTYKGTWEDSRVFDRFGLVVFNPEGYGPLAGLLKENGYLLLKHPFGKGGDYIFCSQWGCKLNSYPVGEEIPKDKRQIAWCFAGFIPSSFFAPLGETARSYDVRLAGLAPVSAVKEAGLACLYAREKVSSSSSPPPVIEPKEYKIDADGSFSEPSNKEYKEDEICGKKEDSCRI